MRVAVFSCTGREKEIFSEVLTVPHKFRFFTKDLSIDTVCLAEGFNTVIISSFNCLTPLVLHQLHRLNIQYIISRSGEMHKLLPEKIKEYNINYTMIPASTQIQDDTLQTTSTYITPVKAKFILQTLKTWMENHKNDTLSVTEKAESI